MLNAVSQDAWSKLTLGVLYHQLVGQALMKWRRFNPDVHHRSYACERGGLLREEYGMTSPSFMAINPVLPVRDLGASVRFYTDRLGFDFAFGDRVGSPLADGSGAPGYAGVRRGNVELHLQWQHESEFTKGTVGLAMLRIRVVDPDGLLAAYRSAGLIDAHTQIRETSWRTREFHLRDLDGHGLTFYCEV